MDVDPIVSVARIATAGLAGVIGVLGFRAYANTRSRSLGLMAVGSSLLALGYLAEGVLVELAGWPLARAMALESVTTLVAAALLVSSLFLRERVRGVLPPRARRAPEGSP